MQTADHRPGAGDPAGVGSIAFLIFYAVLSIVLTIALWATYLT